MNIPREGSTIPSTQPEVKVRTFASDLASIKESGGGLPQFQTIRAPRLPTGGGTGGVFHMTSRQKSLPFLVALVILLISLAGYFVYTLFFSGGPRQAEVPPVTPQGGGSGQSGQVNPQSPRPSHETAFRRPTDQKLALILNRAASSASSLQTYNQKLQAILSGTRFTVQFVEIEAGSDDGNSAGVNDVLSAAGALVLSADFFTGHFNPDITIFAYREDGVFWPGYILTLNQNENWLFLKSEVAKLEVSPKIQNFFLNSPAEHGEFYDATIGSQPARVTDFASGARFVYGWIGGRLVLSTSYKGFVEAVARL